MPDHTHAACASRMALLLSLILIAGTSTAAAQADPDPLGDIDEQAAEPETPTEEPAAEPTPEPEAVEAESVAAEPPPVVAPAPAASDSNEMVVTGSRIKRSSFAQPSAVQVVDRKQLQMTGADNVADVLKYMNINTGSESNTDVGGGAPGTAQFNLRGLGLSSTLVLLNGRRLAQSAALAGDGSNYVDINTIPMQMIERIEILKGGASAIYGSDAVAGVVNVITRKNFEGFEAQVGGQTTDDFDQRDWDVSLMGGARSERTRVTGAVSFFDRDPLFSKQRDFTDNGKNVSDIGYPGAYLFLDPVTFAPVPEISPVTMMPTGRGKAYRDTQCGDVNGNGGVRLSMAAPYLDAAELVPGQPVPPPPLPFCRINFNEYFMLVLEEQRVNTYGTVEQDIGDHAMAFFEAGYARSRSHRVLTPSFAVLQTVIVPADNRYNPTGNPLKFYGRVLGGNSPPADQYYGSDTLHTVGGLSGDFEGLSSSKFGEWEWELSGTWSGNQFSTELHDMLLGPLQAAINSCGPGDNPADCLNPFATGAPNSQAILDRVTGELRVQGNTQLTTGGVDLSGPIVELPGGDLSLAVGAQVRRETASSAADHDSNQYNYVFLLGSNDFQAERSIMAGYGELALPFFSGFELQAAGRVEDYDDVGSTFDPMLGVSWTPATTIVGDGASPASKVRVRGTYATSFRAPSLLQTDGSQTELTRLFDTGPSAMDPSMPMQPTSATFRPVTTKGNPNLAPQSSTAITAGLEWSPFKGFTFQGDYWNYDYQEIIVKEAAQQIIDADFMAKDPANPLGNPAIERDPSRVVQRVNTNFVNASSVMTHGIDVELGYSEKFGSAGTFSFGATGSYVLAYEIPQNQVSLLTLATVDGKDRCDGTTCDVAGWRNAPNFARPIPRLRATLPLGWNLGMHSVAIVGNFVSGYKDDEPQTPVSTTFPDISAYVTLDLQYALRVDEGDDAATTFKVGVLNIADSDPPTVNTQLGYDTLVHDPRGRMIYARVIQEL